MGKPPPAMPATEKPTSKKEATLNATAVTRLASTRYVTPGRCLTTVKLIRPYIRQVVKDTGRGLR